MSIDFDHPISRDGTDSVKHDGRADYFGTADVLPLWVADMDFAAPEAVTQALLVRAAHPVYGYSRYPEAMFEALIGWMRQRHGWRIERDWILPAPGVVPSLHAAVLAFAEAGEGVIVQPPVYYPFFSAVTTTGRRLIENPLKLEAGRYRIDFEHLESCAAQTKPKTRLLLLCSPHNPVGRVWSRDELAQLLDIAERHDLVVLSDEIHHDLIYPGRQHHVLVRLADELATDPGRVVTAVAPSKTFNIPGLGLSALIAPDPTRRAALSQAFDLLHAGNYNPFSSTAFAAGYRDGADWLDALMVYLADTRDYVTEFVSRNLPGIRVIEPEGTYLLWLDCRELCRARGWERGHDDAALKRFFVEQARVGMSPGTVFGAGGGGFMRMNIGAPRAAIETALARMAEAIRTET
ncbi:MAG: aminotransferase [Hydrogenophilales bacterium 28-61-23]|nr:MAG: aminotransferase [Hydrogenophilales bacterium 28-61-23]